MANEKQLTVLHQGVDAWNAWRKENPDVLVDLAKANLSGASLAGANLFNAKLTGANLSRINLSRANLLGADLSVADLSEAKLPQAKISSTNLSGANLLGADLFEAYLTGANLFDANFSGANLVGARLMSAILFEADLSGADLSGASLVDANLLETRLIGANLIGANLTRTHLIGTDFTNADLTGCRVYGISAWDLKLEGAKQEDLIITPPGDPEITVDNLEVAQFIYLLLHNEKIRDVIDTITSKVVLILGSFRDERKAVLEAIREEVRQHDYLPVLFDFEKPRSRSTEETVSTLARMARFVIADLTDAKSVLKELRSVVPTNPSVPVQPLILATQEEPGMFDFFRYYRWMLEPYRYPDPEALLAALPDSVIVPAEAKVLELRGVSPPAA